MRKSSWNLSQSRSRQCCSATHHGKIPRPTNLWCTTPSWIEFITLQGSDVKIFDLLRCKVSYSLHVTGLSWKVLEQALEQVSNILHQSNQRPNSTSRQSLIVASHRWASWARPPSPHLGGIQPGSEKLELKQDSSCLAKPVQDLHKTWTHKRRKQTVTDSAVTWIRSDLFNLLCAK